MSFRPYTIPDIDRIREAAQLQVNTECAAGGFEPPRISSAIARIVLENAAAPVLLAACEMLLSFDWDTLLAAAGGDPYSPDCEWGEAVEKAQAAIAAAKGLEEQ